MRIGFIGLGNMGAAIAANLLKAHHEVAVWNPVAREGAAAARVRCDARRHTEETRRAAGK